ncbi:MAG: ADP-glyceromanno-heptose 6-epimerase [Rhodospirillaceae bacterium]|nr:ADP-glyceromanno-heptose 6-epimerase [Rhodospirillaceae bacterium]
MYVVTGGAGFIGSNIVAALEKRGDEKIAVIDRLRDGDKWKNLAKRELCDIVHPDDTLDFLEDNSTNIKAVFHMGAISATTEKNVDLIIENNFQLSLDLWKWCTAHQTRFIYASSAATYGDGENGFDDDIAIDVLAKLQPLNPYGWSKHLFDRRVARMTSAGDAHPPQWAGLKFFNVYGPNEYHKGPMRSVVNKLYPDAVAGKEAQLFKSHHPDYSDGGQMRDFIYVDDCVDVMMWLLDNEKISGLFNVGTGKSRSFRDLTIAVFEALGKKPKIKFIPTPVEIRDKYQYFTQANTLNLRKAGYKKEFTELEDGIRSYVNGFLANDDPYR